MSTSKKFCFLVFIQVSREALINKKCIFLVPVSLSLDFMSHVWHRQQSSMGASEPKICRCHWSFLSYVVRKAWCNRRKKMWFDCCILRGVQYSKLCTSRIWQVVACLHIQMRFKSLALIRVCHRPQDVMILVRFLMSTLHSMHLLLYKTAYPIVVLEWDVDSHWYTA